MKNTLLTIALVLQCTSLLFAQDDDRANVRDGGKGFYVRAGMGYNFPQAGGTFDENTGFPFNGSVTNANNGDVIYNMKKASFSSGLQGEAGLGYMFNKYIGIELDIAIGLASTKYTGAENNITLHDTTLGNVNIAQYAQTPVLLMPCIVIQNGGKVLNVYARAGIVLPLSTNIIQQQTEATLPGNGAIVTDIYTIEIKNSFSLGFTGAVGLEYNMGATSIWAEIKMLSLSLYPKEGDLTGYSENGVSYSPSLTFASTTTQFSNNVTIPAGSTSNAQEPTYAIPFSNVGIHVGITYKFPHHDYNKGRHVTTHKYRR